MGKNKEGESVNNITATPNGEASESNGSDTAAKAFDTMAKVVRPQSGLNLNQVSSTTPGSENGQGILRENICGWESRNIENKPGLQKPLNNLTKVEVIEDICN